MASVNSFETDMRKLRKKRKRKRALKNLMMMLIVVAFAAAVYLSKDLWLPYLEGVLERGMSDSNETSGVENFPIDISSRSNVSIDAMDSCWTLFTDTTFYTCSSDGTELFSIHLPYSNPVIETTSRRALVYDMGGYNLTVVNKNSEVFSKRLDSQILYAVIGENGNIAVVTSTDKYDSYLTIYDRNGTEIFHWADGNLITSVCLDDSGNGCIVASVYARGGEFKSVVSKLDFSVEEVAGKTPAVNTLCLAVEYTSDGGFWLVGDETLYRFNSDCEQEYAYNYNYEITQFAVDDDVCAMMFSAPGSSDTYVVLFNSDIDEETEITYNDEIHHIDIYDGSIFLNSDTRLSAFASDGTIVGTAPLDTEYVSFAVCGKNVFLQGYRSINKTQMTMHD